MAARSYFGPALFQFFTELRRNNNRPWFLANKHRYERNVREPMLAFIADFAPHLRALSRQFVADPRPTGGSLIRIYRDVRFSPNKAPYKTHVSVHFTHHRERDMHAPGFYFHIEPDGVFAAAGIWHPDAAALARIRDAIVRNPSGWRSAIGGREFKARFELEGDSLTRPPRGFDPAHPLIADLKRKDFVATTSYTRKQACSGTLVERFAADCNAAAPLMRFLTEAAGLPW
jgi:uncharacterized protein (TIGR02453 family)